MIADVARLKETVGAFRKGVSLSGNVDEVLGVTGAEVTVKGYGIVGIVFAASRAWLDGLDAWPIERVLLNRKRRKKLWAGRAECIRVDVMFGKQMLC